MRSASDRATPEAVAAHMASVNAVFQGLGMDVIDIGHGHATVTMTVRPDMSNTYGVCHGGIIFSLADMAFGFAANAYDERIVTASAEIHYLAPVPMGAKLAAFGTEVHRGPRSGLYDVTIRDFAPPVDVSAGANENAEDALTTYAVMRGRARVIGGSVVPAAE